MPRNSGNHLPWRRSAFLLAAICLTASIATAGGAPPIEEIRSILSVKGLWPLPSESLAELDAGRLEAALQSVDPYARYVPSSPPAHNRERAGYLGIELFSYDSRIWVRPDAGSPAQRAGIPEVGQLLEVEGKQVPTHDLAQVSAGLELAIAKKRVRLTLATRPGGKAKTYTVTPGSRQSSSVSWRRVGSDMVIRISGFVSHDTAPRFSAILNAANRPEASLIIDLRGCSGGDLFEALEIAGMFVHSGLPLLTTFDRSGVVQAYRAPAGPKVANPVLILTDSRTASAAELLAGILQYHRLAVVTGERSYGKCVSQSEVTLSNGDSLWLTTLGIRLPDNRSCAGSGIVPDIRLPDVSIMRVSEIAWKVKEISQKKNSQKRGGS